MKKVFKKTMFLFLLLLLLTGVISCDKEKESLDEEVDNIIASFISNYADDYLSFADEKVPNYMVVSAVKHLEENGYDIYLSNYLKKDDVKRYYEEAEYDSIAKAFSSLIVTKSFDLDIKKIKDYFENVKESDLSKWDYLNAFYAFNILNVNTELKNSLKEKLLIINAEDYRDADYAGGALIALNSIDVNKDCLYELIIPNLSNEGIASWGSVNSCSTAYSLMGFLAEKTHEEEIKTLRDALIKFNKDGAFLYKLDDEEVDLEFSTPQVFASLVSYKIYLETGKKVNIFYQ